jgi:hypothetical protein
MSKIVTFRGLLADGSQDRIRLKHIDGKTGYRIKKFQLLGINANTAYEGTAQVLSVKADPIPTTIDLGDVTVLAAAIIQQSVSTQGSAYDTVIIDNVVFSQDIFVIHDERSAGVGSAVNYYLELETISFDDAEATAVILKNFRNTNTVA